jgi:hypothetical protein
MSSSKKMTCKGTLRQMFIDWRYSQSNWYFRPSFNCCPSNLLWFNSPPPPPPFSLCQSTVYRDSGWERAGVLSPVGDHILQEFNTLYLPDSEPTKLLDHPKQKSWRGGCLRQINICRKVPLQANFLR